MVSSRADGTDKPHRFKQPLLPLTQQRPHVEGADRVGNQGGLEV